MTVTLQATAPAAARPPAMTEADSCTMVIFGATGDLTRRKLMPALYSLRCLGGLSGRCEVIGTGRKRLSEQEFRAQMHDAVAPAGEAGNTPDSRWEAFAQQLSYLPGEPGDPAFHRTLAAELEARRGRGSSPNHLFYVGTPASVAPPIIQGLGAAGLARNDRGWSRIVLEKPFGHDLVSARALNRAVNAVFPEEAVFRIDHYLGKETVQNLLVFRFGNSLFEPVWNRHYIEYVEITAAEALGVEHRAAFYEETGALRDMVANHLLQLLTLTAMEPPVAFDADAVRDQKVQVLRAIQPMSPADVARRTVRGQYGPGALAGDTVPGYRDEPGVSPASTTETFAAVDFRVENWRWAGVPFYVRTGKRLGRRMTEIALHFRRTPQALFARTPERALAPNVITLRIQPDEGVAIAFAAKRPGLEMEALPVRADFAYAGDFGPDLPDAYATLLYDAIRGDATLFTRWDEVEAQWRIITPIEEGWAEQGAPGLAVYAAGTDGPRDAGALMRGRSHHCWCPIVPKVRPRSLGS